MEKTDRTIPYYFFAYEQLHMKQLHQLLRSLGEGGSDGAYYSIGHAIWEDDASIKVVVWHSSFIRICPERKQTDHPAPVRQRLNAEE